MIGAGNILESWLMDVDKWGEIKTVRRLGAGFAKYSWVRLGMFSAPNHSHRLQRAKRVSRDMSTCAVSVLFNRKSLLFASQDVASSVAMKAGNKATILQPLLPILRYNAVDKL